MGEGKSEAGSPGPRSSNGIGAEAYPLYPLRLAGPPARVERFVVEVRWRGVRSAGGTGWYGRGERLMSEKRAESKALSRGGACRRNRGGRRHRGKGD